MHPLNLNQSRHWEEVINGFCYQDYKQEREQEVTQMEHLVATEG